MSIKSDAIEIIISNGKDLLQKKALGGVTTDSAQKAIESVARSVEDVGNKEIAKVRMQLNAEKGDLHRQLVEITNRKDSAEFHLKQVTSERDKAQEALQNVSENLKAARKTKVGKPKINSNGNIEITKSNKNGARMTVEYAQNEAKTPLSYKVEDIDGSVRKTTLNPATGKPVRTYTDTNGGHNYEYLPDGTKVKRVNVKNASGKPVKTTKQILEDSREWAKIQQNYSDGSYELIDYNKEKNLVVKSIKMNSEGKKIGKKQVDYYNGQAGYKTWEFNPETGKIKKYTRNFDLENSSRYYEEKIFAEDGFTVTEFKQVSYNGMKRVAKAEKSELGIYIPNNYNITYTYPKNSLIATAKLKNNYGIDYKTYPEILKLKDGRKVELKVNGNFDPFEVTITKGKEKVTIYDRAKLKEFLNEIGYRNGINAETYAWSNP